MPGQLIYCTRMAVGKVRIPLTKMAINQDLKAIKLGSELLPEFFAYSLSQSKIKTTGTTVKGTTIGKLLNAIVLVPPKKEQTRIVSALSKLLDLIEKIEKAQEKYRKLSEALKQKILSLAVSGKLANPITKDGENKNYYKNPIEWNSGKLDDAGTWTSGSTPLRGNACYYDGSIPWIKTGELNDGLILSTSEKVTEKAIQDCHLPFVDKNSVLIAMYGATIGKLGIPTMRAVTNQACCSCAPNKSIDKWFLFYFLLANRESIIKMGAGGAQPNISKEKIISFPFQYPDFQTQQIIVTQIKTLLSLLS
jgi:type I restriction enzyme S subunit